MTSQSAPINLLFRFRDLIADTIPEHRAVIDKHGSCWWGWWQRPSESIRADVWEELRAAVVQGHAVVVGLFNSGSGEVYRATVVDVITPVEHEGGAKSVAPPAEDLALVPEYYQKSSFNRGWLKLSSIEKQGKFFNEYSFSVAPKLPNYPDATLQRLKDKIILFPEELRGMDTTIWRVRPKAAQDKDIALVLSSQALPEAQSDEIVKTRGNAVLHITDAHFATGDHRREHVWRLESEGGTRTAMDDAIGAAIENQDIGLVVVTGDLTFKGTPEEFREAKSALMRLLGGLNLTTDHLVVVPGNHDIQWVRKDTYERSAQVDQVSEEARKNYEDFYRDLFRHEPSAHLAMARRFGLPNGMVLEICALNSSSLETGAKFLAGMGRTDEAAFNKAAATLAWKNTESMSFRILALHHHLTVTEDVEPETGYSVGYGMAIDAIRVQRKAAGFGVHLALHGHKHRAFVWRSSVYELPERAQRKYRLGELSILGGGSVGSKATENGSNFFNILHFAPTKLSVEIYRALEAGQGSFEHFQTWDARIRVDEERKSLVLDDWQFVG